MMIQHAIAGAITALAAISSCDQAPETPAPPVIQPARPAQQIYIPEDYNFPFRAEAGDTLILVMTPDDGMQARCEDAGGQLIQHAYTDLFLCFDADF